MMSSINKPSKSSFLNIDYNNLKRSSVSAKMNQSVGTSRSMSGAGYIYSAMGGPVVLDLARLHQTTNELLNERNKMKPINKKDKLNDKDAMNLDTSYKEPRCHMTFIFDPNGRLSYWMGFVVSLAFLYNFWVMIYRFSFNEINSNNKVYWFTFDYLADLLYICDILFNFRTGFLEEGVLQTDPIRLRHHYMNTTRFYIDCLCLMPLDILYLSLGYNSIFRCFRLVKIYRFWGFLDRTERHTNFPNLFRTIVMLHYLFAIFHWNACLSYFLSRYLSEDLMIKNYNQAFAINSNPTGQLNHHNHQHHNHQHHTSSGAHIRSINNNVITNGSQFFLSNEYSNVKLSATKFSNGQKLDDQELIRDYLKAFYLSTKIMTLVSEVPNPKTSQDYLFAIFQLILALLLFANIMGHVGYIVSNLGNARKEFQSKLDAVKTYMSLRRVPQRLQDRVIRWFDFLWTNHKSIDDNQVLNLLPYKLRAEIAIHVHLDTLKRVEIFQNTEAGFLNELVLRLKPVLYSPGDYICRKGEVGKEMYIVNGGKLQVISDNGKIVLATLKAGSYFGEISILNMGSSGNRRTASVKSVGYSDLFCLSKEDLWEVLKEYPAVRVKLEAIAVKRLEKHKKPLSELVNISRCKSSPGLLEPSISSKKKISFLKRHGTLPTNLLKRTDLTHILSNHDKKSNQLMNDAHKKNIQKFDRLLNSKNDEKKLSENENKTQINEHKKPLVDQNHQRINSTYLKHSKITETFDNSSSSYEHPSTPTSLNINSFLTSHAVGTKASISTTNSYYLQPIGTAASIVTPNQENQNYSLQSQHVDNFYLLREIERLKNCIYYLEGENMTLNLKLDKFKNNYHNQSNNQNSNTSRSHQDYDIVMKAKQESDLDDIK